MLDQFEHYDDAEVRTLISEYPLAWLIAADGKADQAAQLPLLGEYDDTGALESLFGHIPWRHPLVRALQQNGQVLVLFQGPQAYVSPGQVGIASWAPTWNFAQLSIEATLEFLPEETGSALTTLVEFMERGRPAPWDVSAMGERYEMLANRVVGFRARVGRIVGRFKLGQDERPEVRDTIIRSLGDTPLARWMDRFAQKKIGA